ncbi:hypothetical protein PT2222_100351 [Paraburkholderia tropica]
MTASSSAQAARCQADRGFDRSFDGSFDCIAPEVLVVDVLLRHERRGQLVFEHAGLQLHDVAVVIGLARLERLALQRGLDVIEAVFRVEIGRLRNRRIDLALADRFVFLRNAVIRDDHDMLRVARRKQQLLAAQRLQRGREIDAARLHVDRLDVRVRGQQAVERARRHVALPARRNLQQRERRILLQAGAERLGAVAPVDGSQIAHDLHDLARLHVLADVLAGFFAVSVIVGAHDHRHVALGGRDVHGHDLHVLLRRVVERAADGGRIDRPDHDALRAQIHHVVHVGDLLRGVVVRVDGREDVDAHLFRVHAEVVVVRLPERRREQRQAEADLARVRGLRHARHAERGRADGRRAQGLRGEAQRRARLARLNQAAGRVRPGCERHVSLQSCRC